jgi:16S rRNA processing protein RimM
MVKDDFFYLGKILKPFGSKGHLLAVLDVDDPSKYRKIGSVFLGIGHDRVPFMVESVSLKQANRAVFKFEDVDSASDASIFQGKELFLPIAMLPPLKGKKFYYHEIKGFAVIDKNHGPIGIADNVIETPHQALLQVKFNDREILVPLINEIIVKVDRVNRELHIKAPEGLIEIYL